MEGVFFQIMCAIDIANNNYYKSLKLILFKNHLICFTSILNYRSIAKVIIESGKNNMIMALKGKWIDSPRNPQTKETEARGKYPSIKIFNMLIEKMPCK